MSAVLVGTVWRSNPDMANSKATILGGFGFIGGHLANHLVAMGYDVTLFGHPGEHASSRLPATVTAVYGDFSDASKLKEAISGSAVVFHLIGNSTPMSSNQVPSQDVHDNLLPTLSLFEACASAGVKQVVFASSGGTIYGVSNYLPIDEQHPTAPICAYGVNKLTTEHYMRLYSKLHGIAMTTIRISNPYGPSQNIKRGQGIIGTYCEAITDGRPLQVWGDGSVVRDYIYIQDVAEALERVIGNASGFNVYNLGTGIGTSINDLVATLSKIEARALDTAYLPGRDVDVPANVLDAGKFMQRFDWKPKSILEQGLRLTLDWYRDKKQKAVGIE